MEEQRLGCLGWIFSLFGLVPQRNTNKEEVMPFALRDDFLSKAEFSFYRVLIDVIDEKYIICPKVSLNDIFFVTNTKGQNKMTYHNKINRKHVDFLLCERETMKPVVGIELDDSSHNKPERISRDKFVDELFKVSGIPLVRFQAKYSYLPSELNKKIEEEIKYILKNIETNKTIAQNNTTEDVMCPKCGMKMVLKKATKGKYANKEFYGCVNYPKCKEIINTD